MDQSKKTMRHFYCRDVLWETFEQMANDFDCSIDYLINEAMRYYARSKNYQSAMATSQPPPHNMGGPTPGYGGYAPPPGPPQMGQGMPPGPAGMPGQMGHGPGSMPAPGTMPPQSGAAAQRRTGAPPPPPMGGPGRPGGPTPAMRGGPGPSSVPAMGPPMSGQMNPLSNQMPGSMPPGAPMPGGPMPGPGGPGPMPGGMPPYGGGGGAMPTNASTLYLIYNNQRYPITKDQFIIGRGSKTSDLPIKDGNISRKHAAVIRRNGTYYIKDLGSTNGIDYKGMRIDNKRIDEGDVFHLCDYELRFTYRPD